MRDDWRLLIDDGASAAGGLATDEAIMSSYGGDAPPAPTLRLYTYRRHCALVGRFQDPEAELRLDECEATGTPVNRRPTGGGAIVMGDEQLGVALVTSLRRPETPPHARAIIDTYGRGIARGLAKLGIDAEVRGKNDIAVNGRKVAGLGIYAGANDSVLFHASVLAGLDIDFMLRVLNIPLAKLADKAVSSVRQRITTVSELAGRQVAVAELRELVRAGFEEELGVRCEPGEPSDGERREAARLVETKYGTAEWLGARGGEAPAGSSMLKTPGGLLRIAVGLSGEALKEVLVTGDFMAGDRAVAELEAALRWAAADRRRVTEAVDRGIERGGGLHGVTAGEITEAVWAAVVDAKARRGAAGSCYYPEGTPAAVGAAGAAEEA